MSDQIDHNEEIVEDIEAVEEAAEQKLPEEEKKSVASVDQASGKTSRQPARKGDKLNAKDEPAQQGNVKFKEDLDALVDSEVTLSEGFREKAATIFEAAFSTKVAEEVERLEEQYEEKLTEATDELKADLVEKVDGYLNYVVEQWMEDNRLAVENGLRTEIAEDFMSALKSVFTEHYIQVPEAKIDLVDSLAEQVEELNGQLGKVTDDNIKLAESVKELKREAAISEATEGLTLAQAEKLNKLVENVEFDSDESFAKKLATIKESYFRTEETVIAEEVEEDTSEAGAIASSPMIQSYLDAIAKTSKK